MTFTESSGLLAACLTTGAYLPQVIKILRTRDTSAISVAMYAALNLGMFLWLIYGFLIGSLPLVLSNGISLMFTAPILVLKLKHG